MEPGPLLASGRAADVYDQGDGTVLRRYKFEHDVTAEGRLMGWLAHQGYPVPGVHLAEGNDIVMSRIDGPTMLEDLGRRPWRLARHARLLAQLQRRLNDLRAPSWLRARADVPSGDSVLHLDLHPMNVMLADDGPIVIDWTNATRGDAWFDAAMSSVLMSTAELIARREQLAVGAFVFAFDAFRGRKWIRPEVPAAARFRLSDPNITDLERARLQQLSERHPRE